MISPDSEQPVTEPVRNPLQAYLAPDRDRKAGVIDRKGNWIVQPNYQWIDIVSPERFLVQTLPTEPEMAKGQQSGDMTDDFCKLLNEQDFIGMSSTEVQKLMTKFMPTTPERNSTAKLAYQLIGGSDCVDHSEYIEFQCDKTDTVTDWRHVIHAVDDDPAWISENVQVPQIWRGLIVGNLVPKK
jgi:hypothetical protein